MSKSVKNMSIASDESLGMDGLQKFGVTLGLVGLFIMVLALLNVNFPNKGFWLTGSIISIFTGIVLYANRKYLNEPEGIKNNGVWHENLTSKGSWGWMLGIILTSFYVVLYWFPKYLGLNENGGENTGIVGFFDPFSLLLNGKPASQWFVYGSMYTIAILGLGYKFILKYRHNKYQLVRTISVMFFQLGFAFLIPEILEKLNPDKAYFAKDLKNIWPLNYYFFNEWHLKNMINGGSLGIFVLSFGIALIFIISPILTYFYGKRWYCSCVCGCGGLAETAGDSFRHLSSTTTESWNFDRWLIN